MAVWAGETLHLLPSHALWWPKGQVLFMADVHLGKAGTYRKLGQPVPDGTTRDNLRRLTDLIAEYQPTRLIFLGDLFHAAAGKTPSLLQALQAWRERHHDVAMTLVRGNHDDRAGDPPPQATIDVVDEPFLVGPFACCHHPRAPDQPHATHFVLAGHLHPVCRISGPARESLRLPCFVTDEAQAILPAFGAFTGGHALRPAPGRRFYAVGGQRVWALP
jgi:uncharacterized protein